MEAEANLAKTQAELQKMRENSLKTRKDLLDCHEDAKASGQDSSKRLAELSDDVNTCRSQLKGKGSG